MKKFLAIAFVLCLLLTMAACEKDAPTTGAPSVPTTQPTEKPTQPTTAPTAPTTAPTEPTTAPTEPVHVHAPNASWLMDKDNHWQLCEECGETINESAHTLDAGFCTQCEAEIFVNNMDGSTSVYVYDAFGNTTFSLEYDSEGNLLFTYNWEYTYDDAGNMLTETEYTDGAISYYAEYALDSEGLPYTAKVFTFFEDGTSDYQEYDQWLNNTLWISYNADDTVLFSIRNEFTCDDNGNVLYQKTYEDDVLTSESEYTFMEGEFGAYTYCSKEITYFEDGSKLITEYDEFYEIISEVFIDANGNPVDHSGKFDPEACAPLFGVWEGNVLMDGDMMGMAGLEGFDGLSMQVFIRVTFKPDGTMQFLFEIDPDSLLDFMVEFFYKSYETEFGMNRDEADAQLQQEMGMTVREYVQMMLSSGAMDEQFRQEMNMVYYVENGKIFAGESWTNQMEPLPFTLDGDTLTLKETIEGTTFEMVLTKAGDIVDSADKFDPEACAPLFGTWLGMITLDPSETGLPTSIRYEVALTFHADGRISASMTANIGDVKAATVEKLYQTFEMMGMTRADADAAFMQNAGMTIDEYVDVMLASGESDIELTQEFDGVYYAENGQIFASESWTDEMAPADFTLEGNQLTLSMDGEGSYTFTYMEE